MEHTKALGFEFKRMSYIIGRGISARMAREGFDEVAITHGWILGYLYNRKDETIYQRDLEEHFGMARSSVANLVKLMEQKGYLERRTDGSDARYKRVSITEHGIELHLKIVSLIDEFNAELENGISPEQREIFLSVIDHMAENLQINSENGGNNSD